MSKISEEITQIRKPYENGAKIYFSGKICVAVTSYRKNSVTVRVTKNNTIISEHVIYGK